MVDIIVMKKYLGGNLTGIGLKGDFGKDRMALKKITYHAIFFEALSVIIILLNARHLILVNECNTYACKIILQIINKF